MVMCLALLAACSKGGEGDQSGQTGTQKPDDGAAKKAPPKPTGPVGKVSAKISFAGEAPEMKPLKRGSDAFCARTKVNQETVVLGKDGKTLQNVVVRIKPGTVKGPLPAEPVVVTQSACMYRPRVMGGMVGQTLEIRNADETFHNIHGRHRRLGQLAGKDTIFNKGQPAKGPVLRQKLPRMEILELKCDVHGWMKGFVVLSDHPYSSVTDESGTAVLENVPVGEYEIEAWHELYGVKTAKVRVEEGATAELELGYDAATDTPQPIP
ncbi:MAG: TonB-dependent receptor [Deltaproteobacteria bacterium]|nr:TonB-dependent receptor [Deltaproteobacteria bacterium]